MRKWIPSFVKVGQNAELMEMVSRLECVGLVVDQRLDMIFEQLRKQDEDISHLGLQTDKILEMMAQVNLEQYFSLN